MFTLDENVVNKRFILPPAYMTRTSCKIATFMKIMIIRYCKCNIEDLLHRTITFTVYVTMTTFGHDFILLSRQRVRR